MPTLVLLRHGQSQWNLENRFTGWWDVDLSERRGRGGDRGRRADDVQRLGLRHLLHQRADRAIKTLDLALEPMDRLWLPVRKHWRLNERHYGGLTGLNKQEMREKVGDEQVKIWRRSFDIPPPPLEEGKQYDVAGDRRYAGVEVPVAESLKDTIERVLPYWDEADRAGAQVGPASADLGARKFDPGARQAPVQNRRRRDRRGRDPDRGAAGLRARRRP
jgi:2,3-bisphosphoglycerate-dependent phosphoglycerate mutase